MELIIQHMLLHSPAFSQLFLSGSFYQHSLSTCRGIISRISLLLFSILILPDWWSLQLSIQRLSARLGE